MLRYLGLIIKGILKSRSNNAENKRVVAVARLATEEKEEAATPTSNVFMTL